MKKLSLVLIFAFSFLWTRAQVYTPTTATVYGSHNNRLKADSVLHVPRVFDLLAHTTDTTPQLRIYNGRLIWGVATSWAYNLQYSDTGRATTNLITGGTMQHLIDSIVALTVTGYVPVTRTITINGSTQSLSANRTWTIAVGGTTDRISVTGGSGLTPTIDIASTYVGQTSITTLGTIITGIWHGTAIADTYISSAINWNTAYTQRIATFTTTGSSGAATFSGNALNIPTYTLAGLGGQPQLNGTGYVKMSGTTVSYVAAITEGEITNLVTDLASKANLSGAVFTGTVQTNLLQPNVNNTYDIGTTALNYKNVYAYSFIKNGGTSSQGLMADGSVRTTVFTLNGNSVGFGATYTLALNGISDVSFSSLATGDYLRYTGSVWANRTPAQVLSDIGGASDASVVHISGIETILGAKTFSGNPTFNASVTVNSSLNVKANNQLNLWNAANTGYVALKATAASVQFRIIEFPDADGTVALTSSNITGNAATATLATNSTKWNNELLDYSTVITTAPTYVTGVAGGYTKPFSAAAIQSFVGLNTSNWVDITSVQTISGAKTFSSNVSISTNNTSLQWTASGNNVALNANSGALNIYTGTATYNLRTTWDASGNIQHFGKLTLTSNGAQSTAWESIRAAGNDIEFGHPNGAGYGSTIGAESTTGVPFIAFNAEAGTNNNTYKTRGIYPSIFKSDLNGGFIWGTTSNANADNQNVNTAMTLSAAGNLVVGGTITGGNLRVTPTNTIGWTSQGGFESVSDGNYRLYNEARNTYGNLTTGNSNITTASNSTLTINTTGAVNTNSASTVFQRSGVIKFYAGLGAWTASDNYEIASASALIYTLTSAGAGTFASTVTATSFIVSSDLKLKNVLTRQKCGDKIDFVSWTWKDKSKDTHIHYGYIAQEVEKILPQTVYDNNGTKAISISEVQAYKIAKLELRIEKLEKLLKSKKK